MGDFFHGWRRKIGAVTLLMAFVFTVVWARSVETLDVLSLNFPDFNLVLVSGGARFMIFRDTNFVFVIPDEKMSVELMPQSYFHSNHQLIRQRVRRASKVEIFAPEEILSENRKSPGMIPYWSIVLPLNLLSAYLLLIKPRVMKPKMDSLTWCHS